MRVPHVNERIKEAPAQALRGMFAGIGQLLLVTDKLRNKGQEAEPEADAAPAPAAPAASAAAAAAAAETVDSGQEAAAESADAPAATRDLDKTGNVRLLTDSDAGPDVAEAPAAEAPAAETPAAAAPASASASLPLPSYDDLSVASLRARLRNLTADQVAELAAYEKANAARPEVVAMFERRIAKLAAESAG
jgi:hypothetical protein